MKLADLRRWSIREQSSVHFRLANGMECIVNEHGIAQLPTLKDVPDFNLEQELASASEFLLAPMGGHKSRRVSREELETMTSGKSAAANSEHEDE